MYSAFHETWLFFLLLLRKKIDSAGDRKKGKKNVGLFFMNHTVVYIYVHRGSQFQLEKVEQK